MAAKTPIPVSIVGGIDDGTTPYLKTRLESLKNGVYEKKGGITKRYGTRRIGSTSVYDAWNLASETMQTPTALHPYKDSSVLVGGNNLYTLSYALDTANNGKRNYVSKISECTARIDGVYQSIDDIDFADSARISNYVISAWMVRENADSTTVQGKLYALATDETEGTVTMPSIGVATGSFIYSNVRVLAPSGATSAIFVYGDNAGNVYAKSLNLSTWALSSPTTLLTGVVFDSNEGSLFDAVVVGSNFAVVCQKSAGNTIEIFTFNTSFVQQATGSGSNSTVDPAKAIAVAYDGSTNIYVAYIEVDAAATPDETYGFYCVFNTSLTRTLDRTQFMLDTGGLETDYWGLGICHINSTTAFVTADTTGGAATLYGVRISSTGTVSTARSINSASSFMLSRPWYHSGNDCVYQIISCENVSNQRSLMVIDWQYAGGLLGGSYMRPVCSIAPRQILDFTEPSWHRSLASVNVTSDTDVFKCVLQNVFPVSLNTSGPAQVTLNFNDWRGSAEIGNTCMLGGGCPSSFDGISAAEVGFVMVPKISGSTLANGSGFLTANSTYSWKVVTEWLDANGNVMRSPPSEAETQPTGASNDQNTLAIHALPFTNLFTADNANYTKIRHVVYRTTANGSTYYRVGQVENSTASTTVTFLDIYSDTTIAANEQLYTMGSVDGDGRVVSASAILDNVSPPSARFVTAHFGRYWLAGTPDDSIWYSKKVVPFETPNFNEALTLDPFEGGRVTGLSSDGDRLLIFKETGVWQVYGDGNNNAGVGSTLSEPKKLTDIGCSDARTIVSTPFGVFYLSPRGIFMISRGGIEVAYVGEDVKDKSSSVATAVFDPSCNRVRFGRPTAGAGLSGELVYDIERKTWSEYVYRNLSFTEIGPAAACMSNGVYNWIAPDGQEYEEDSSTYLDCGSVWVPLEFETGWLRLGEVQGYARVSRMQILGENHTEHAMTVYEYTDYQTAANGGSSRDTTSIDSGRPTQFEFGVIVQRCQAIKFRIIDSQGSGAVGTGKGTTVASLMLLGNLQRGKWRPAASTAR